MVDKVICGDKVAVLISSGYWAGWTPKMPAPPRACSGWTTWNQDHKDVEQMLYDPDIVNAILQWEKADGNNWKQCLNKIREIANAKYNQDPDDYFFGNGLRNIEVVWVHVGRKFIIREQDGSESIHFCDEMKWITP